MAFLVQDPDLGAKPFTITRRRGKWRGGRLEIVSEETIKAVGNFQPPTQEQLAFFPEGERREGQVAIWTNTPLHTTKGEEVSDTVTWRGEVYRIIALDTWVEHGFCVAYGQKED